MASVNKVILIGRLGKNPEVRNTQDGRKIVNLSVATSESWNDRASGERKERTEWHRVVVFNERLADIAEKYLKKGSQAFFEGTLQTRKWTDQEGNERYSTEVILGPYKSTLTLLDSLDNRREGGGDTGRGSGGGYGGGSARRSGDGSSRSGGQSRSGWDAPPNGGDLDDEIPF